METKTQVLYDQTDLLDPYDPKTMNILGWMNAFEFIMDSMRIMGDSRIEYLLKLLTPFALDFLQLEIFPAKPSDLSYDELMSKLEICFSNYKGEAAASFRFFHRMQFIGESIPQYVLALRKISSKGSGPIRENSSLLIQFIRGLNDQNIKLALLFQNNLTFSKAVAIAQQMELFKIFNTIH